MRPTTSFLVLAAIAAVVAGRKNALKTKKYKCIEVMEDDDSLVSSSRNYGGWSKADEELRPIGSARLGTPPPPTFAPPTMPPQMLETTRRGRMMEEYQEYRTTTTAKTPSAFISPMAAPRDKNGNPLVLSPQHCNQVKHYAGMYGVRDVLTWVKSNCAFAKMYLPTATCEEINILIGSCYPSGQQPQQQQQQQHAAPRPRPIPTTPPPAPTAAPAPASSPLSALFPSNWNRWFW